MWECGKARACKTHIFLNFYRQTVEKPQNTKTTQKLFLQTAQIAPTFWRQTRLLSMMYVFRTYRRASEWHLEISLEKTGDMVNFSFLFKIMAYSPHPCSKKKWAHFFTPHQKFRLHLPNSSEHCVRPGLLLYCSHSLKSL